MTQDQQFAAVALFLANRATAPTDDQTQSVIIAAKQWLARIARGELVVMAPKQKKATKPAAP